MGLSYKDVEGTDMEDDWHDIQGVLHGSISKDKRNIVQKTADDLYQSGILGATMAAVADIVPGIPFVDIIDPPSELSGKGMQEARNLLGGLGVLGGLYKTPQAVGRVATNIREPYGYGSSLQMIKSNLGIIPGGRRALYQSLKAKDPNLPFPESFLYTGLKAVPGKVKDTYNVLRRGIRSIVKDEPLYHLSGPKRLNIGMGVVGRATDDAREYLYRTTFGLKPRRGKNIFIENADGTLSLNPKSKRGKVLIREILAVEDRWGGASTIKNPLHSVMGGYTRKELGKELVSYEDIWDFKMNPSDWKYVFEAFGESPKRAAQGTGMAALRSLVHTMTKPPHIKGVADPFDLYPSWMGKYKGLTSQVPQ
jgi:hypothetical protein